MQNFFHQNLAQPVGFEHQLALSPANYPDITNTNNTNTFSNQTILK